MRKFRVGDRVRFELDGKFPEWPRWNYAIDGEPSGKWKEGIVRQVDDGRNLFYLSMPYSWPQPDHPSARYGAPGYLELVEAVEDQQTEYEEYIEHHQPPGTTKTVTVDEVADRIETMLLERVKKISTYHLWVRGRPQWADGIFRRIAKERAQAIAEALVGCTITKKKG